MDDKYLDAYILRANTRFKLDNPDGALQDFTKVLELQPDNKDLTCTAPSLNGN